MVNHKEEIKNDNIDHTMPACEVNSAYNYEDQETGDYEDPRYVQCGHMQSRKSGCA